MAIQKLIVKRAVAFTFGNPVTLNAEPEEGTKEADVLKAVKRVLFDTKSRTLNRKVARAIYSSTEAAELWYPVEKPTKTTASIRRTNFGVAIFSPLFGDRLYPYFDETGDMVAFSREYVVKDSAGVKHTYFETYTDTEIRKWTLTSNQWQLLDGYPKKNQIGKIPVIYGRQPAVEWEDVQNLIDRLEKLLSNFADTNDYHASPKIFTTGTILGWAKKGESGAVIEGEEGATAQYLKLGASPRKRQIRDRNPFAYDLHHYANAGYCFRFGKGYRGRFGCSLEVAIYGRAPKSTGQMRGVRRLFAASIKRNTGVLAQMNAKDKAFVDACGSLIIEPEIVPFMIEDEAANVNLLLSATGQKAICSRKTAVQQLGWVNDTEEEIAQIESEEGGQMYNDLLGQEPTI